MERPEIVSVTKASNEQVIEPVIKENNPRAKHHCQNTYTLVLIQEKNKEERY